MKKDLPNPTGAAIWERVVHLDGLSSAAARSLLKLRFSDEDQSRMQSLSAKARTGDLTPREKVEIGEFERLGCLLDILHSKARSTLKKHRTAS